MNPDERSTTLSFRFISERARPFINTTPGYSEVKAILFFIAQEAGEKRGKGT